MLSPQDFGLEVGEAGLLPLGLQVLGLVASNQAAIHLEQYLDALELTVRSCQADNL